MARISWFTQPNTDRKDLHFASFYMYDTDSREFVRIRLDLRRHDGGKAKIICKRNRIVLSMDDGMNFQIIKNDAPTVGTKIYDFTIGHKTIHHGNSVTGNEYLPDGITVNELTNVALQFIGREEDIELASEETTEEALSAAILKLIPKS